MTEHDANPTTHHAPLPEGDSWTLELVDPSRRQLVASLLTAATSLACLALAARRAQLDTPNEVLTLLFGLGLAALALTALARLRFTRSNLPLTLSIDPEHVSMPHLGWRFGLASIPWNQLTGVGVRKSGSSPHSVALVTESRTYLLPRDLVPEGLSPVQIAGIIEHFRRLHTSP